MRVTRFYSNYLVGIRQTDELSIYARHLKYKVGGVEYKSINEYVRKEIACAVGDVETLKDMKLNISFLKQFAAYGAWKGVEDDEKIGGVTLKEFKAELVETAIRAKFEANPDLKYNLMATGCRRVFMMLDDEFLGCGSFKNVKAGGENVVGKCYEKLRSEWQMIEDANNY